ncbi:MAG: hypothetical protein PUB73_06170 [Bacteroidales bacterium]|nr:hypothetical protein [Bacteroidales bacterium]
MIEVRIFNIDWDTDNEVIPELPTEINVELSEPLGFSIKDEEELANFLSDYISDTYGFCHFGFDYKIISK